MQFTPPHSPDPHGTIKNHGYPLGLGLQHDSKPEDQFTKRPISPPLSSGENSDSQIKESHPVSLLSALMHSPRSTSNPASSGSGMLSPHSSVPSTAVSSPHLRPVSSSHSHTQGGLEIPAMSILRRDSVSSDGEALSNGMMLSQHMEKPQAEIRPDAVKRASSLKFAVAPPLKRRTSVNPHTPDPQAVAKFDTPPTRSDLDISVEIEEDVIEEDVNEEEMNEDGSEESDLGYQEDSESSDEDGDSPRYRTGKKYPFARPTNYRLRRPNTDGDRALSPSPPPAPAVLPPPTRRGRGHIRVDESCISGKETEAGCSRHRSPPPSRSRSHSRNRHGMGEGRLSDAGPREGRAGSPMPSRSKILAASDEEDDDEDEKGESPVDKKDVFGNWGGWRSDDAAFKGGMVKGIRTVSAPGQGQSAITDDEDHHHDRQIASIHDDTGARSFFRRASEHIPIPSLRRDPYPQPHPQRSPSAAGRALSPSGSPCPPALDGTPILAKSVARVEKDYSGGLAHRLEQSLSASARSEGEGTRL